MSKTSFESSTCCFCTPLDGSQNSARVPKPASSTLEGQPSPGLTLHDLYTSSQCFCFCFPSSVSTVTYLTPSSHLGLCLKSFLSWWNNGSLPVSRPLPLLSLCLHDHTWTPAHPGNTCSTWRGSPPHLTQELSHLSPHLFQREEEVAGELGDPPVLCEKLLTV